ncbi:hypothetical protein [Vibrio hepatarius]|uniref:hypothetical protein n=1 Tax=Vibrio hepatarius TaxID=171383 RepID=UPI001C0956D1|nr:hypothetical protein [Vibrio hepatarius]MBU2898335.1 hypothetical protein [Vibrio hepatarius]
MNKTRRPESKVNTDNYQNRKKKGARPAKEPQCAYNYAVWNVTSHRLIRRCFLFRYVLLLVLSSSLAFPVVLRHIAAPNVVKHYFSATCS